MGIDHLGGSLICQCLWCTRVYCHNDKCSGLMACAVSKACISAMTCFSSHHCAVWDSSIVVAKFFERWGNRWAGKRCLDLSAGCGLVGAACLFAAGTRTALQSPTLVLHPPKSSPRRRHVQARNCCLLCAASYLHRWHAVQAVDVLWANMHYLCAAIHTAVMLLYNIHTS